MAETVVGDLAVFLGMPVWFVGGLIGLAALLLTITLTARFLKARGIMLTFIVILIMVVNVALFAWPFWPILIVAGGLIWQVMALPTAGPSSIFVTILKKSKLRLLNRRGQ